MYSSYNIYVGNSMKDDQNNAFKLGLMILDSLNGSIDEARFTELDKMIINDPTTLDTYLEFIALHAILNQQGNSDKEPAIPFVTSDIGEKLRKWQELEEYEEGARRRIQAVGPHAHPDTGFTRPP